MKKFIAIFFGVAALFASCNSKDGNGVVEPNFPPVHNLTVESGKSYEITFTAEKPWSVLLPAESQVYATLSYDGVTDTQFYGVANEECTIVVNVREGVMSYAKDIVFNVQIELENISKDLALLTVKRTPYEITVTGTVTEGESTFEKGGHPADGPFASVPNTYKVTYKNRFDGPEAAMIVEHNFDKLYNYRVYAKTKDEEGNVSFGPMGADDSGFPWVRLVTFGPKGEKFRLTMEHGDSYAVLTAGVGYEAYVNIEDENGDAIVSVYYLYNPNAVAPSAEAVLLYNATDAAANGVKLEGGGVAYKLTLSSPELLTTKHAAAALKVNGFNAGGFAQENLRFAHDEANDYYYVTLAEGASLDGLARENNLSIATIDNNGLREVAITVILDWIAE
jgi:hypothetical protein